jgi:hypothetical protein
VSKSKNLLSNNFECLIFNIWWQNLFASRVQESVQVIDGICTQESIQVSEILCFHYQLLF